MYDIHYNYIKTTYGDNVNYSSPTLTLSHTKLRSKIFTKYINPVIEKRFHTSDYQTNQTSGILTGLNSKVLGMFKNEACGK